MKRFLLITALLSLACGTDDANRPDGTVHRLDDTPAIDTISTALELRPEIQPEGLDSLYSRVAVTDLTFYGALHLVPVREDETQAASTAFKFDLAGGVPTTTTTGRPLRVDRPGRYTVLMTIHPMGGGHSVDLAGARLESETLDIAVSDKGCRGEAAPTTADENEMEAAPTTARGESMEAAPITANEDEMEAAPVTADEGEMEAAPTTANLDETMEAAPTTANEEEMEAAPVTADGSNAPLDAQRIGTVCSWEERFAASGEFRASSDDSFEFDLGAVDIRLGDEELVLYWNMSDWVALLMGNELGLSFTELLELHEALLDGTDQDFNPDAVRIETN